MKRFFGFFITLVFVFFAAFYCGIYWQKSSTSIEKLPQPVVKQEVKTVQPAAEPKKAEENNDEQQIAEALNDPDFRRVHDFLERENPMQMNLQIDLGDEKKE